jgi:tetratricopeptide (TPR) repeat protein
MALLTKLVAIALGQALGAVGEAVAETAAEAIGDRIHGYWRDPGRALPKAIAQATEQTWTLVELSLAGDSLGERLRRAVTEGTLRGAIAPLRALIARQGEAFRVACLAQLRAARREGLLVVADPGELARRSGGLAALASPAALIDQARQAMADPGDPIRGAYPELARLLADREAGGPLLLTAFSYFLRQAIAGDGELNAALQFEGLERLWQAQAAGFADLRRLLTEQGDVLAVELAQVGSRLEQLARGQAEHTDLLQEILRRLSAEDRHGPLRPGLSASLRNGADSAFFAELRRRVSALPAAERSADLLDALGRLGMAVGDFAEAGALFTDAAARAGTDPARAEAHYASYRALLEQRHWDAALGALLEAARLDPARFEPFPLEKYPPQGILGAGGFGVAFLCRHAHLRHQVVIKSLYADDLDRTVADVFQEGRILRELRHPGIIEISEADYAGRRGERPYLVMDHFPGLSLERHLERHGPLTLAQTLALARPVAEALQAAHTRGILHRDLKPDNLLVRRTGDGWAVKVIDFGLAVRSQAARESVRAGGSAHSIRGESLGGTYRFSAPEQLGLIPGTVGPWSRNGVRSCLLPIPACSGLDLTPGMARPSRSRVAPIAQRKRQKTRPDPWVRFKFFCPGPLQPGR